MRLVHDFLVFWGLKRPPEPTLVESLVRQWHDAQSAIVACDQRKAYWTAESKRFSRHLSNLEAQVARVQADTERFRQLQKDLQDDSTYPK